MTDTATPPRMARPHEKPAPNSERVMVASDVLLSVFLLAAVLAGGGNKRRGGIAGNHLSVDPLHHAPALLHAGHWGFVVIPRLRNLLDLGGVGVEANALQIAGIRKAEACKCPVAEIADKDPLVGMLVGDEGGTPAFGSVLAGRLGLGLALHGAALAPEGGGGITYVFVGGHGVVGVGRLDPSEIGRSGVSGCILGGAGGDLGGDKLKSPGKVTDQYSHTSVLGLAGAVGSVVVVAATNALKGGDYHALAVGRIAEEVASDDEASGKVGGFESGEDLFGGGHGVLRLVDTHKIPNRLGLASESLNYFHRPKPRHFSPLNTLLQHPNAGRTQDGGSPRAPS